MVEARFTKSEHHDAHVAMHEMTLAVKAEFKRALSKHGFDRTPANPKMTPGERIIILVEEVGEVARAMTYDEGSAEEAISELVQVATMALASAVGIKTSLQTEGV